LRFTDDWLNRLKDNSDIVSVLERYIRIEPPRGNKYWACCPFHHEKTPSFLINREEQYYHCFGCQKSGSVITFLMEHQRLAYQEAVETLARWANMELPTTETEEEKREKEKKERALKATKDTARFYYNNLLEPAGAHAINYLFKRGFSEETIRDFALGYSPDYHSLTEYLKKMGHSTETMVYAKLVSQGENGKISDFQARRLVIPIINTKGNVVAFGGRALDEGAKPKYKNSSNTPIFEKRRTVFALNLVKKTKLTEKVDSLIVVEGYMDAISLYQAGIKNVVACMGTALTPEQCREIKRHVNLVYTAFDGDTAGTNATWESLDALTKEGLDVRVISMPNGIKDPDDMVKAHGKKGFLELLDRALPAVEYKIRIVATRHNLKTAEGKGGFVAESASILATLSEVEQEAHLNIINEISAINESTIRNTVKTVASTPKPVRVEKEEKPDYSPEQRKRILASRYILSSYVNQKPFVILKKIEDGFFDYPPHLAVYLSAIKASLQGTRLKIGQLFDIISEHTAEINKIIQAVNLVPQESQEIYYLECLQALKQGAVQKRITQIKEELKSTEDADARLILMEELQSLLPHKPKKSE